MNLKSEEGAHIIQQVGILFINPLHVDQILQKCTNFKPHYYQLKRIYFAYFAFF